MTKPTITARINAAARQSLVTKQAHSRIIRETEKAFMAKVRRGEVVLDKGEVVEVHGHHECHGCHRIAFVWHVTWWEPASDRATTIGSIKRTPNFCAICRVRRLKLTKEE